MRGRTWDVFCRRIDYLGDVGVCWRLCADLAARGETVRLFIDDAGPLAWLAPGGAEGVSVADWSEAERSAIPAQVVIEAFGCNPSPAFVARMRRPEPPVWIDLEYLSAEDFVERQHGLPSPQQLGPGRGLVKRFFFPGFTAPTGGLLREPDLLERRRRFDPTAWLDSRGIVRWPGERIVALFCYEVSRIDDLVEALGDRPTVLLAAAGVATSEQEAALDANGSRGRVRGVALPLLEQRDFDHLLWAADLNFVRGEDSFVRAQWAGKPFVWQAYRQQDGAHAMKVEAFSSRFLAAADRGIAGELQRLFCAWNGLDDAPLVLPSAAPWQRHCEAWRATLLEQRDLVTQLLEFVDEQPQTTSAIE